MLYGKIQIFLLILQRNNNYWFIEILKATHTTHEPFKMSMNAKIIAVANHKGGCCKTTSVGSLGAALAKKGYRVLLVDLDAQQNLTFTVTHTDYTGQSIYHSLVKGDDLPVINIAKLGLDIVPAGLELARAEIDLATKIARERMLKLHLDKIRGEYDYILLDCPPSLGIITTNALVAADQLFIPLTAEALPYKGLNMLEEVVGEIKRLVNPNLEIAGVFFTRYSNRKLNKEVVKNISERFGDIVFQTKIRENITLAEMPLSGGSIFDYDDSCNGAKDYMALAEEVIARNNK